MECKRKTLLYEIRTENMFGCWLQQVVVAEFYRLALLHILLGAYVFNSAFFAMLCIKVLNSAFSAFFPFSLV